MEIYNALRFNKKIIKINFDEEKFDNGIETYLYALNQLQYNNVSYESKESILESLSSLDVKNL